MQIPGQAWFYVILWIACSCSMILFNKAVLSKFDFPFPIFLTTWHMLLSSILTFVLSKTTKLLPGVKAGNVDKAVMQNQILPVAILFAASLIFANKAYIYLSVSFIQMLKAFTPVVVLFLSVFFRLESSTWMELNIVLIISLGVALTSIGELQFNFVGFVVQLIGITAESGRLVLTNMLLKKLKLDSLSTLYYVAPVCFCCNFLAFMLFEFQSVPWEMVLTLKFAGILVLNGLVAFSLNIALVMVIAETSALILTLAGIVKDVLLVGMSMLIFQSPVSTLQYIGYAVALLALNLHKEYKKMIQENVANQQQKVVQSTDEEENKPLLKNDDSEKLSTVELRHTTKS